MAESTISVVGTPRDDQSMKDLRRNPDVHASDEDMASPGSQPQPQSSSTARRGLISSPSPEPYLPQRDPASSNIDETNATLGPRGSNDHFAGSSTATLTRLKIPEQVQQYFSSLPRGQWGEAWESIQNNCGDPSSTAFDGTPHSSPLSENKSPDASNLDFMSARFKYRKPSPRPAKARKIASAQPRSNAAGPSKRRKTPQPAEREYIEISSGDEDDAEEVDENKYSDDEDKHSDDDFEECDDKNIDEVPIPKDHAEFVRNAVDILVKKEEPDEKVPDFSDSDDNTEAIARLQTQVLYNIRMMNLLLPTMPSIYYRSARFDWGTGPVIRKTAMTKPGSSHAAYWIATVNTTHYLLTYNEKASPSTVYYRIKKVLSKKCTRTAGYAKILRVIKEVTITTAVDRDRLNIDAESKGVFYGKANITVKAADGPGTTVIRGKSFEPTLIPAASRMISVELNKRTKRIVGAEGKGPFSRGKLLKRIIQQQSIIVLSKGHPDRNLLTFLGLATDAKLKMNTKIPSLWLGDRNPGGLWIFASVKRGNKATISENKRLVAKDALYVGVFTEDGDENDEKPMSQSQINSIKGFIKEGNVPQELVPRAEALLQSGNSLEAETLKEEELYDIIMQRGKEMALDPPPQTEVIELALQPAFSKRDVELLPRVDLKILPPAPQQAVGDTRYQLQVNEQPFTYREIVKHPDETLTVHVTVGRGAASWRRLSREEITKLMDPENISLWTIFFENARAISDRSPDPAFGDDLADSLEVLTQTAQEFFPGEVPPDGPLPVTLLGKARVLLYSLLTVNIETPEGRGTPYFICLACGRAYTNHTLLRSHLISTLVCARIVAKIRPVNVPEPPVTNADPHWCSIHRCKGSPPLASQEAYDAHWLTHRVQCQTCAKTFDNKQEFNTHKKTCAMAAGKTPLAQHPDHYKTRAKVKCLGCGTRFVEGGLDSHLKRMYDCALAYAKKKPRDGQIGKVTYTNPHWCHIRGCKARPPVASATAYRAHWLKAHRKVCKDCGVDFYLAKDLKNHSCNQA